MQAAAESAIHRSPSGACLKLHRFPQFGEVSKLHGLPENRRKPTIDQYGTPLAVSTLLLSGAPKSPRRRPGRGGARNRSARESHALTAKQVGNLAEAAAHALTIGLPFNRMVTIHWEKAGVPLAEMARATGKYIDLVTKALARRGHATAWLWVHENGKDKGGHCHILIHVPASLVGWITGQHKKWIRRISGRPYRDRTIKSVPIGRHLGVEESNLDLFGQNLLSAVGYVLKGADDAAAAQLRLTRQSPEGRVIGRRCSTSQNIGWKARQEWRP